MYKENKFAKINTCVSSAQYTRRYFVKVLTIKMVGILPKIGKNGTFLF